MILNILQAPEESISLFTVITAIGGLLATFVIGYLLWILRTKHAEHKALEAQVTKNKEDIAERVSHDQRIEQSFEDYKAYKVKEDETFAKALDKFGKKIDDLTREIKTLELTVVGLTK